MWYLLWLQNIWFLCLGDHNHWLLAFGLCELLLIPLTNDIWPINHGQGFGKFKLVWTSGTRNWKAWAFAISVCFFSLFPPLIMCRCITEAYLMSKYSFVCHVVRIMKAHTIAFYIAMFTAFLLYLVSEFLSLCVGNFTKTIFKELFHLSLATWRASSAWTCIITTSQGSFLLRWGNWSLLCFCEFYLYQVTLFDFMGFASKLTFLTWNLVNLLPISCTDLKNGRNDLNLVAWLKNEQVCILQHFLLIFWLALAIVIIPLYELLVLHCLGSC